MKLRIIPHLCIGLLLCVESHAQSTAFTYQGQLIANGSPANGNYDLLFILYNASLGGNQTGPVLTNAATPVTSGLFSATLDFGGGVFTGSNYWLEIDVRQGGNGGFTTLSPRQPIIPTPYAIFAKSASNVTGTIATVQLTGSLPVTQIAGTLPLAQLPGAVITNGQTGVTLSGTFSGNGAGLTSLSAANLIGPVPSASLTSVPAGSLIGTISSAQLPSSVVLNNYTGLTLSGTFSGNFNGNGALVWQVPVGTNAQAQANTAYLLTNSQQMTLTLPVSPSVGSVLQVVGAGSAGWIIAQNAGQWISTTYSALPLGWVQTSAPLTNYWSSVASSSDGTRLVAGGINTGIWTSTNSGFTWAPHYFPLQFQWDSVASSSDGTRLVAGGINTGIWTSTDSGTSWTEQNAPSTNRWLPIVSSADGTRLAAISFDVGNIWTSTNSGTNWAQTTAPSINWWSIASSADGTTLAAVAEGNGGGIWISTNAGASWTQTPAPSEGWISIASSSDGTNLIAAAYMGGIWISANEGNSWTEQQSVPEDIDWMTVASSSDGTKLAVAGSETGVWISTNGGNSWTVKQNAPTTSTSIASSSDGTKLAAAGQSGIWTYQSASAPATTVGPPGSLQGAPGSSVQLVYVGGGLFIAANEQGIITIH